MPYVPTWPVIIQTFNVLVEKLETVPPELRPAVIDYWLGRLFEERSKAEFGTTDVSEQTLRKYHYRPPSE